MVRLLRHELDTVRTAGQHFWVTACASLLGRSARVGNQRIEAEVYLDESLTASLACPDLNRELFTRVELAVLDADLGRVAQAKEQIVRCREIVDDGENWRGHGGAVAYATAIVEAAEYLSKFKAPELLWAIPSESARPLKLPDRIFEGFSAAIEIFRRYHAPWEEASALTLWSRVLLASGHHRQSVEKFNLAFAIFDSLKAPAQLTDRVHAEIFRFMALSTRPSAVSPSLIPGANLFRKEGEYWTISFEGSVFRLHDTMGMHYISRLVTNPGVEFSAKDLAAGAHQTNLKRAGRKQTLSHNGRINGESDLHDDAVRERARLMVTKRIRDVIARIRTTHPELARHFATCIRTGYICSYTVDEEHLRNWTT